MSFVTPVNQVPYNDGEEATVDEVFPVTSAVYFGRELEYAEFQMESGEFLKFENVQKGTILPIAVKFIRKTYPSSGHGILLLYRKSV